MTRPDATIFKKPFDARIVIEKTPAPANFKKWDPACPDLVPTFPIFEEGATGEKIEWGVVTSDHGFEETPDAEMLLGGINDKGPRYAAVARHGSFVLWGFHCTPDRFTAAGRRVFLNTLDYASAARGRVVESLRRRPVRSDLLEALTTYRAFYPKESWPSIVARQYVGEVPAAVFDDAEACRRFIAERAPYLHPFDDGDQWKTAYQLTVDPDLSALGVSNGDIRLLDTIAERLTKDPKDEVALRLLKRYVPSAFPEGFAAWLESRRAELYFTESGGWVWRTRGMRAMSPAMRAVEKEGEDEIVRVRADVTESRVKITLKIREGWHCYPPGSTAGEPVSVKIVTPSSYIEDGPLRFEGKDQEWTGYVDLILPIRRGGRGQDLEIDVGYTVCDAATCRPRKMVRLRL